MTQRNAQDQEMNLGSAMQMPASDDPRSIPSWLRRSPITRRIFLINLAIMLGVITLGFLLIPPPGAENSALAQRAALTAAALEGTARPTAPMSVRSVEDWHVYLYDGVENTLPKTGAPQDGAIADAALRAARTSAPILDAGTAIAAHPVRWDSGAIGAIVIAAPGPSAPAGFTDHRGRLFIGLVIIGGALSLAGSLAVAATITKPLKELVTAAEGGQASAAGLSAGTRVRIPDLTDRPDDFGRLSGALRDMVTALYSRIEANEQFAADVSHELKNPLASLRSAVGTMRVARREDQRDKLLEVIDHDVQRLDRLVSDISNASRLDCELVKEEEAVFDLRNTLTDLADYLGGQAETKGVTFFTDFPAGPVMITGLEARLAQVFVNLITNALSFSTKGDAIRLWLRERNNRVIVAVEDTGPGIPSTALERIFQRFYSQRPEAEFGEHSGLGLAISRQIVEAHGGVIWAENIHPTEADPQSEPMGARFVVALPL